MTKRVASFLLMEYFGQKEEKPCGICDVCIGKKKRLHREERKSLEEQILQVLAKQNTNIGSWCVNWVRTKEVVIGQVRKLLDEGKNSICFDLGTGDNEEVLNVNLV